MILRDRPDTLLLLTEQICKGWIFHGVDMFRFSGPAPDLIQSIIQLKNLTIDKFELVLQKFRIIKKLTLYVVVFLRGFSGST